MTRARKESKSTLVVISSARTKGCRRAVNAIMLGGLGIDDFFALERGLRHCWPSKR